MRNFNRSRPLTITADRLTIGGLNPHDTTQSTNVTFHRNVSRLNVNGVEMDSSRFLFLEQCGLFANIQADDRPEVPTVKAHLTGIGKRAWPHVVSGNLPAAVIAVAEYYENVAYPQTWTREAAEKYRQLAATL